MTRPSASSSEMNLAAITSHIPRDHLMLRLMDEPLEGLLQTAVFTPPLIPVARIAALQLKLGKEKPSDFSK